MRFASVLVLLFVATAIHGADDVKFTRKLDGVPTTFPAKSSADGIKATVGAIESCHSTGWAGKKPPELADPDKARKGDHVRLVFGKPIEVTVLNDTVEVSEVVFSAGAFLLRSGDNVLRCTKYEHEKMKPFEAWYRQTLPAD